MRTGRTGLTTTRAGFLAAGLAAGTATAAVAAPAASTAVPGTSAVAAPLTAPSSAHAATAPSPAQVQQARFLREVVPLVAPYDMGVAIRDNRTGVWLSYRGDKRVFLASTTKLATSAATFLRANELRRGPTPTERAWMVRALQVSDNNAQSALWRGIGSHAGFARLIGRFGLRQTAPFYGYGWGRTMSTPLDQVRLLEALRQHVSPLLTVDEEWLLSTMRGVNAGQTWGAAPFGRGPGRVIEVKNGWSPFSDNGRWRLSSVGHVRDARHDYTVAILSNGWRSTGAGIPRLNAVGWAVYRMTGH